MLHITIIHVIIRQRHQKSESIAMLIKFTMEAQIHKKNNKSNAFINAVDKQGHNECTLTLITQ